MFHVLRRNTSVNSIETIRGRRSAKRISIPFAASSFPLIQECPPATCSCRLVPTKLDIEREQDLSGSMAAYAEHVLISTGKGNWASRIENDAENATARLLKHAIGPKGRFSDVCQTSPQTPKTQDCPLTLRPAISQYIGHKQLAVNDSATARANRRNTKPRQRTLFTSTA